MEQPLKAIDIERRRHRNDPKIFAQRAGCVERQRECKIVIEAALVDLIEQHGGDAEEFRIGLDTRQEHAVRHNDDARALSDFGVETRGVADRLAGLLAQHAGHKLGSGTRGEPARYKQ